MWQSRVASTRRGKGGAGAEPLPSASAAVEPAAAAAAAALFGDNTTYVRCYLHAALLRLFPNLGSQTSLELAKGMLERRKDYRAFKQFLRDLLVASKTYGGAEANVLFDEEAAAAAKQQQEELYARVPGMQPVSAMAPDAMDGGRD